MMKFVAVVVFVEIGYDEKILVYYFECLARCVQALVLVNIHLL